MFLLGISGGSDSMFLLHQYQNKKIVVAHVNYHLRPSANDDQKIVEDFCQKHQIKYHVLNVKKIPAGNFQNQARIIRYDFFAKIYQQYQCKKLLLAHHKDDFLETALMQQRTKRLPEQFGIAKYKHLQGMNIYRPFIDLYYKDEILSFVKKKQIPYAIDETNEQPVYSRNKIRLELKTKSIKEKNDLYGWFKLSNKILVKKHKRIKAAYQKWASHEFALHKFRVLDRDKEHVVFEYVHLNFPQIKISSSKLKSLVDFIQGTKAEGIFKLNDNYGIEKKQGKLTKIKF